MVDDLLRLAMEQPERARRDAEAILSGTADPARRAAAHRAIGIVLRDLGRAPDAIAHLRSAVAEARRSGERDLEVDVRATLGATLVVAGQARAGSRHLDAAVEMADTPMNRMRRGLVRAYSRDFEAARVDLEAARDGFRDAGDELMEARALHNLGYLWLRWGRLDEARRDTARAATVLAAHGMDVEALWAEQNLGEIDYVRGDLPSALATLDRVATGYAAMAHHRPYLAVVRCMVYLAAGLGAEAVAVADEALAVRDALPLDLAAIDLWGAAARLDRQELSEAIEQGARAHRTLRHLDSVDLDLRARLVVVRARSRRGDTGRRLAEEAVSVAEALDARRADEAPVALIVASRLDAERRAELLSRAAAFRTRSTSLVRASGWLAGGLARELEGDRGGVLRACGRGLDALDDHRRLLGSTELRALATAHGAELAELALRHAADHPRDLLRWSERWRSTALSQPPVTPGDSPGLESLAALRDSVRRLVQARTEGEPTEELEKERTRLERRVRAEHHQLAGTGDDEKHLDVDDLVARVGDGTLVELVDVDGDLHVLVVHGGRVRRKVAGTTAEALAMGESARFLLRRSARGRPYAPGDLGQRLEQTLLGDAARMLPEGPVVVVPTARLHGVPWALLPSLADRPFTVTPSAAQWVRAADATSTDGKVALLAGPGLGTGGAEVPVLAKRRPDAVHLAGDDATVEAALDALDGARLAHVAAHGRFRADSPLFSSLELADGPLTVHDLERLTAAPHRMVLSACESGVLAPVGADELLGLASALFALGTAGLVCSVAEVNDVATASMMVDLHGHLDRGLAPAEALLELRRAAEGDTAAATAAAFVALGA